MDTNTQIVDSICHDVTLAYSTKRELLMLACRKKDEQIDAKIEDIIRIVQQATTEGLYTKYIVKRVKELLNNK